jgi:DUF4097 and DUF4098 domain-containing protein YvlB
MNIRIAALCLGALLPIPAFGWSASDLWDTVMGRYHEDVESHKYPFPDPHQVIIETAIGSIDVKTWHHDALMVEIVKKGTEECIKDTRVIASLQNGTARFTTHTPAHSKQIPVNYTVIVPAETSMLSIKTEHGDIAIKNMHGAVTTITENGSIDIRESTASITAQAQGSITVTQRDLSPTQSLFLKARDSITLALPTTCNAHLSARTLSGSIRSALYITFDPLTTTLSTETWKRLKRFVQGSIGAGGAPITLETQTGIIDIREL